MHKKECEKMYVLYLTKQEVNGIISKLSARQHETRNIKQKFEKNLKKVLDKT